MGNCFVIWEIFGLIFVIAAGAALHFVYGWTGRKTIAGIFSPINESVWEHLKLIFYPMLFFSIAEYILVGKEAPNFIAAKSFGILFGMLFILLAFYLYVGILGKNVLWVDILIFILGVVSAYKMSWNIMQNSRQTLLLNLIGGLLILLFAIIFTVFTFRPPQKPLFLDPVTKEYGIAAK